MRETKWFRLILIAILTAAVFSACGGGSDDGDDGEDGGSSEPVSAEQYARDFCSSMVDWQGEAQQLSSNLQSEIQANQDLPVPERKEKLNTYLEELKGATESFIDNVEDAGVPDVEDGQEIADTFLSGFRELLGVIEEVQGQIADLPDDPQAFETATDELGDQLQSGFETVGDGFEDLGQTAVDQAFNDVEECRQIQSSP